MHIGPYKILGRLGRGGMGSVYKVVREDLGKIMALKVLMPRDLIESLLGPQEVRARFIDEARTMAGLDHRNVATIWDLGKHNDKLFMTLEYFCMNLGTLIGESYMVEQPSRPLPPPTALDYTLQTLEGLVCLHQAGIVHRDIKPFNLMLTSGGGIKIIDLGISKVRGEVRPSPRGLKVGSPYYAAPEQETAPDQVDLRADLYSVGVLLYRLVTGRLPEKGAENTSHPLLDAGWRNFFSRALGHRPQERFDTAVAMLEAVRALETDWTRRQERECGFVEKPPAAKAARTGRLRRTPIKTGVKAAAPFDGLDRLFRPRAHVANDFVTAPQGVRDCATGLLWSPEISYLPMPWADIAGYLKTLNRENPVPDPWRLPTVAELSTLLRPRKHLRDFCAPEWFDQGKPWLWTGDKRSFTTAWFVDVANGAVLWQDFTCRFHVLAVSSP